MITLTLVAVAMVAATLLWLARPALQAARTQDATPAAARALPVGLAGFLLLATAGGYALWGTPAGLVPSNTAAVAPATAPEPASPADQQRATLAAVETARQQTQRSPQDAGAWASLARSQLAAEQLKAAVESFRHSLALRPGDADTLTDLADVLAVTAGRTLDGEPLALIDRALQADPNHTKALALSGIAALQRGDPGQALASWERAIEHARADDPIAHELRLTLAQARQQAQAAATQAAAQAATPANTAAEPGTSPAATPSASGAPAGTRATEAVSGRIQLDPALAARVQPDDTVFVFARAAQGSRMPLAIQRHRVSDLPLQFTLDDSQAMSPAARLSGAGAVVVGARISRSGQATPQPGDLEGLSAPVKPGAADIAITIGSAVAR
jgi:cytochrome c-type biogenesis protein CcmH